MKFTDEQAYALKIFLHAPHREQLHNEKHPIYENRWKAFSAQRGLIRLIKEKNVEFEEKVEKAQKLERKYKEEFQLMREELAALGKSDKDVKVKAQEKTKLMDDLNERYNEEVWKTCGLEIYQFENLVLYKHKDDEKPVIIDIPFSAEHKHMELIRDIFDRFVFTLQGFPDEITALAEKLGFTK